MAKTHLEDVGNVDDNRIKSETGDDAKDFLLGPPTVGQKSSTNNEPTVNCHQQSDT